MNVRDVLCHVCVFVFRVLIITIRLYLPLSKRSSPDNHRRIAIYILILGLTHTVKVCLCVCMQCAYVCVCEGVNIMCVITEISVLTLRLVAAFILTDAACVHFPPRS